MVYRQGVVLNSIFCTLAQKETEPNTRNRVKLLSSLYRKADNGSAEFLV